MEKAKKIKAKRRTCGISISWKLFAFLVAFLAFLMAVIWVFQVPMLDSFYKRTKRNELERISVTVETLQLWVEKMIADGKINMDKYKEIKSK